MICMEPLVMLAHRHIMHGWGWGWHRDHHIPHGNKLERNDWYALVGTGFAILLFTVAGGWNHWLWWVGLGMTIYGACYALLHDGLVHKRWSMRWRPAHAYLKRLIEAHHLHHAVREKEGGVSFGFLYAPATDSLREELRRQKSEGVLATGRKRRDHSQDA